MALEHLIVLDLTHMLSGPYGTMMLADLGARTIKIEPPGSGEATRRLLEHDKDYAADGMGAYFLTLNRNKRSLALDLKQPAARAALFKLIATSDAFLHNMRPSAAKKLGIAYADVRAARARFLCRRS